MEQQAQESPSIDQVVADAPAPPPVESSPEPITPDSVTTEKAPEEHLPDSSLVSSRLQQRAERSRAIDDYQRRDQEHAKLKKEVEMLRTLRGGGFDAQYDETVEKIEARNDDQSALMKELRNELKSLKTQRDQFRDEIDRQEDARVMREAQNDVVSYVKEQREHAPLLNEIGQQQLVFQKMVNEQQRTGQYISEAQAMSEVEAELRSIVERCAPLLGYMKSEVESKREEQVSVGSGTMSMADPLDLSGMSEDEALNALVSGWEKNQR